MYQTNKARNVACSRSTFSAKYKTAFGCVFADAYKVTEESTVVLAAPSQPFIKLDDKHYK